MKNIFRSILLMAFLFGISPAYAVTPTGIKSYSETAASNNSATPNGAPTGWAPSTVGPTVRQIMAEIRRWYDDPAWEDRGDAYTYTGSTSFKVTGIDVTAFYPVGLRVRAIGSSTGTIYGTIATSSFSTDTSIGVTWDSGSLSNETLAVSRGFPTAGAPIASSAVSGFIPVTDATITTTDVTTNNVSTSKHGWMPKATNSSTLYYDALGGQTNPALNAVLTGYSSGAGTVSSTDTVLGAIQKINGNISAKSSLTLGTATAFNSATTYNVTGLPAGIKQITMNLTGVTLSTTAQPMFQIGDATGGLKTSGYNSSSTSGGAGGGSNALSQVTTGMGAGAAMNISGANGFITFNLVDAANFIWVASYNFVDGSGSHWTGAGDVTLSAAIDRITFTTVSGVATWTAGKINISYQ